ncbi:hypothetical protein [uncultured Ruegeria sp.]|uniref:hypothetical protein n=1 Tax=uncultured Ruegeria sp. TaxID=259304 RepID=UPI00344B7C98
MENDGDGVDQIQAALRWPEEAGKIRRFTLHDKEVVHLTGKRAAQGFDECHDNQIIISAVALDLNGNCGLYDPDRLLRTGSLSFSDGKLTTSAAETGHRLWSPKSPGNRLSQKDQ